MASSIRRSNSSSIARLFLDGKYSDLLIRCRGREMRVHRAIVCPQSPFFERTCSGGFRDEYERAIDLHQDDPDILHKFLEFLYTGDVPDPDFLDGHSPLPHPGVRGGRASTSSPSRQSPRLDFQLAIAGVGGDSDHRDFLHAYSISGSSSGSAVHHRHSFSNLTDHSNYWPGSRSRSRSRHSVNEDGISPLTPTPTALTATPPPTQEEQGIASLYTYTRLYSTADKYEVARLKSLCAYRWARIVRSHWPTVVHWGLDQRIGPLLHELFDSTPERESETEGSLRSVACDAVALCYQQARANVRPVMEEHAEFAIAVLDRVVFGPGAPPERVPLPPADLPYLPP